MRDGARAILLDSRPGDIPDPAAEEVASSSSSEGAMGMTVGAKVCSGATGAAGGFGVTVVPSLPAPTAAPASADTPDAESDSALGNFSFLIRGLLVWMLVGAGVLARGSAFWALSAREARATSALGCGKPGAGFVAVGPGFAAGGTVTGERAGEPCSR